MKSAEDYFDKMKELLKHTNPELETVVDIALKQERIQNEKKSQKILTMFQEKDELINELQTKIEEMNVSYICFIKAYYIRLNTCTNNSLDTYTLSFVHMRLMGGCELI